MIVTTTNIGQKTILKWKNKNIETGIIKKPTDFILLEEKDVKNDNVIDRKYHGGFDKACYVFSENHYNYWKKLYPNLEWHFGMFGENITINGLNEKTIFIGDIYKLGDATVQVSQPRQPCLVLGVRFGSQNMLKQFIKSNHSGVYLRIIEKGKVKANDSMSLIERQHDSLSVFEICKLLYDKKVNKELINIALNLPYLAKACKKDLLKKITK